MNEDQLETFARNNGIYPDMFISSSDYDTVLEAIRKAYEAGFNYEYE